MADDLASGFQNVDKTGQFEVYSSCLTLLDSIPFFAEYKRESYGLLNPSPGRRMLEVGCGLGMTGVAALSQGIHVVFSDYDATALRFAAANALEHGFRDFELLPLNW